MDKSDKHIRGINGTMRAKVPRDASSSNTEHIQGRNLLRTRIADVIEREIHDQHAAGDRLPSEAMLAKRFNTSVLTVREALARLAEKGLIVRHQGSGTYVADFLANRYVAILVGLDIRHYNSAVAFLLGTQSSIQAFFRKRNMLLRVYHGHGSPYCDPLPEPLPPELAADLDNHRVMGAISLAMPNEGCWNAAVMAHDIPVVGDGSSLAHRVVVDYRDLASAGIAHLAAKGCRRVGLLAWGLDTCDIAAIYKQSGLEFDPRLIWKCDHPTLEYAGYEGFTHVWSAPAKPDGLLVCDELLFRSASMAIVESGIAVPRDLRVVTHAIAGSHCFVPFPVDRMEYDPTDYGQVMSELLVAVLDGRITKPIRMTVGFDWRIDDRSVTNRAIGATARMAV